MAFSGAWNDTFLAVSGPWNQEKPFWSFQGPEMTICWRFQGPEKTPYWLFQAPEIRKSLFGVFRGLKWPYVGVFRGLKRHLIGWKRWYYGSILKWLTNTEKTVPTQSGSVQVLPQHIFFVGGVWHCNNCPRGDCPRRQLSKGLLSKGQLSKETFVQGRLLSKKSNTYIFVQGTFVTEMKKKIWKLLGTKKNNRNFLQLFLKCRVRPTYGFLYPPLPLADLVQNYFQ